MKIRIRTKLAAALALPLMVANCIAIVEVAHAGHHVSAARTQQAEATATLGPAGLVAALQREQVDAADYLAASGDAARFQTVAARDRRATDEAVAGLKRAVGSDSVLRSAYRPVLEEVAAIGAARAAVDAAEPAAGGAPERSIAVAVLRGDAFVGVDRLIVKMLDANSALTAHVSDAGVRNVAEILDAAQRFSAIETSTARAVAAGQIGRPLEPQTSAFVVSAQSQLASLRRRVELLADKGLAGSLLPKTTPEESVLAGLVAGAPLDARAVFRAVADEPDRALSMLSPQVQFSAKQIVERSSATISAAQRSRRSYVLIALLTLAGSIVIVLAVSRSITGPLIELTQQADHMSRDGLPRGLEAVLATPPGHDVVLPEVAPVVVHTQDEIADVAAALNTVRRTAVDLAVEQAVLRRNIADAFVNLGRRTQNLIGRQLDVISQLERAEADPDTLANLFRLDHLATRMRRNAESLIVLAGLQPARQWSAPVSVTDVVRAALGEVEGYQRVEMRNLAPAAVSGGAAAELAHLLAELIENALVFSPPTCAVEVMGRPTAEGYLISIVDHGIGMKVEELERANVRLAGEEAFTVAPSRYLGHYVAGHLARRLGVTIRLEEGPDGGVTARLRLPASIMPAEAVAPPVPPMRQPELVGAGRHSAVMAAPSSSRPDPVPPVAAPAAPVRAPAAPPLVAPEVPVLATPGGLVKRVRGAQTPDTSAPVLNRRAEAEQDWSRNDDVDVMSFLASFNRSVPPATDGSGSEGGHV